MRNAVGVSGQLYLLQDFVCKYISVNTIKKWIQRDMCVRIDIEDRPFILYTSIPAPSRAKLPPESELVNMTNLSETQQAIDNHVNGIKTAYKKDFSTLYKYIQDAYSFKPERVMEYAHKWCAWKYLYPKIREMGLKLALEVINTVFPGWFACIKSLSRFICRLHKNSIETVVISGKSTRVFENRVDTKIETMLFYMLRESRHFSYTQMHSKVMSACQGTDLNVPSVGWFKMKGKDMLNNIELYKGRYGSDAAQERLPSTTLIDVIHPNTQWQIDGWTLPFWVNGKKSFERWSIVVVWDSHSRKILGYSVGKTENTMVISSALEDAVNNTGVLPAELIMDKHSFTQTQVFATFKAKTERLGVEWTITTNPRKKHVAERYNQYLDEQCKEYRGYLGKGIKAKSRDARRTPEDYDQLRRPENQYSPEELKAIAVDVVICYNKTPLSVHNGLNPARKHAESGGVHAIPISEKERLNLFKSIDNHLITSGCVIIKLGVERKKFPLPADLYREWNNRTVSIAYEDLDTSIYLFDPVTSEFIVELYPGHVEYASKKDQETLGIKPIPKNAGKRNGIISKAKKEYDSLLENTEAIELIKPYAMPKEISSEIRNRADLAQAVKLSGIDINKLPTPKTDEPKAKTGKDRQSPFYSNKPHQIKKLDIWNLPDSQ